VPIKKAVKARKALKQQAAMGRAKYPRNSVEKALRIPKAIIEQNAVKACTPKEAAAFLGATSAAGPFAVEVSSAMKYGFLERPEAGKIQPTDLARRILRPTSPEDEVKGYREAVLKRPKFLMYISITGERTSPMTRSSATRSSKTLRFPKLISVISSKSS
jgi:hypothetical protein